LVTSCEGRAWDCLHWIKRNPSAKAAAGGEMGATPPGQVTRLLQAWSDGDAAALEQLTPLVYEGLRRLAARYMRREHPGHTLQTSALINEAYLRLVEAGEVRWQNRAHSSLSRPK